MTARDAVRRRSRSREGGVALLLAVWLLALLAVVAGEVIFSTRVRAAAERNRRDDLRAWSLAIAGYRAAVAALDDRITATSLDADDGLLLHYHRESAGTPASAKDVALGDGTYSWRIADENGLVSVNGIRQRAVLVNVLKLCGMGPGADRDTVVDSILDWRDQGRDHRLNGAEEDYYRSLDPPYSCKDANLEVIEELLLVRGVTPALFFGTREGDHRIPGLRDVLSAHALEEEVNPATAPKALLEALGRQRTPRSPPSGLYRIVATGNPGGGAPTRTVQAVVQREDTGGSRTFALLYWSDTSNPEPLGREDDN